MNGLTGGHVVIAELQVRPERLAAFIALARAFASDCLQREAGCLQFQVVRLDAAPPAVLFFEVYDSQDAFEQHCNAPHLKTFQAAFQGMVMAERAIRQGWREPDRP